MLTKNGAAGTERYGTYVDTYASRGHLRSVPADLSAEGTTTKRFFFNLEFARNISDAATQLLTTHRMSGQDHISEAPPDVVERVAAEVSETVGVDPSSCRTTNVKALAADGTLGWCIIYRLSVFAAAAHVIISQAWLKTLAASAAVMPPLATLAAKTQAIRSQTWVKMLAASAAMKTALAPTLAVAAAKLSAWAVAAKPADALARLLAIAEFVSVYAEAIVIYVVAAAADTKDSLVTTFPQTTAAVMSAFASLELFLEAVVVPFYVSMVSLLSLHWAATLGFALPIVAIAWVVFRMPPPPAKAMPVPRKKPSTKSANEDDENHGGDGGPGSDGGLGSNGGLGRIRAAWAKLPPHWARAFLVGSGVLLDRVVLLGGSGGSGAPARYLAQPAPVAMKGATTSSRYETPALSTQLSSKASKEPQNTMHFGLGAASLPRKVGRWASELPPPGEVLTRVRDRSLPLLVPRAAVTGLGSRFISKAQQP